MRRAVNVPASSISGTGTVTTHCLSDPSQQAAELNLHQSPMFVGAQTAATRLCY
jgi:hypothetical protein